ncbi:MAG: PfkB family carbohydrate kinase [Kouleothrix sp.]
MARAASDAAAVCLSGSLPPGSAPGDYGALVRTLRVAGRPIWIDTSGAALAAAIEAGGASIKVNADEAAALVGARLAGPTRRWRPRAAAPHRRGGGADPGWRRRSAGQQQGSWHAQPPAIRVVSSVGSGDAFLAALVVALVRGQAAPAALCQAVAAGAANALSVGGGQIDTAIYQQLLAGSVCERLD